MVTRIAASLSLALLLGLLARSIAEDGGAVYRANCASCHGTPDGAAPANAPGVTMLRQASPEAIPGAILSGPRTAASAPTHPTTARCCGNSTPTASSRL